MAESLADFAVRPHWEGEGGCAAPGEGIPADAPPGTVWLKHGSI